TGLEIGNQEDIEITEKNYVTEILNEKIQIDEEVNYQQDNAYTENKQVEEKRLYSQAAKQLVTGENTRKGQEVEVEEDDETKPDLPESLEKIKNTWKS
ncbi:22159_t:CDS:2, partial [Gigaspora margarita]